MSKLTIDVGTSCKMEPKFLHAILTGFLEVVVEVGPDAIAYVEAVRVEPISSKFMFTKFVFSDGKIKSEQRDQFGYQSGEGPEQMVVEFKKLLMSGLKEAINMFQQEHIKRKKRGEKALAHIKL